MRRILVLANNLDQASFRVRVAALAPLLLRRGFELAVRLRPRQWLLRRRLLASAGEYHAVLLQRKLLDPSDARLLRRRARRIYYDIDDAVMEFNRPAGFISRWRTARRFDATTKVVDHVVAGNEYLADIFRRRGRSVSVAPTVVDPGRYQVKRHDVDGPIRLVWIGSRSTLPYLREILPALEASVRVAPGLRLLTIADESLQSTTLPIEHEPWSAATESGALCRGDVGIAPSPTDSWTLGKCGFKLVQYMAAGLPTIASPVGANAVLVRDGQTGFSPATPGDWPAVIARLAGDRALRASMGAAGRALVEREYNLERVADLWAELLVN